MSNSVIPNKLFKKSTEKHLKKYLTFKNIAYSHILTYNFNPVPHQNLPFPIFRLQFRHRCFNQALVQNANGEYFAALNSNLGRCDVIHCPQCKEVFLKMYTKCHHEFEYLICITQITHLIFFGGKIYLFSSKTFE